MQMKEVMAHPWFNFRSPKSAYPITPSPFDFSKTKDDGKPFFKYVSIFFDLFIFFFQV